MASTVSSMVVIACPQCETRYQVPPETLGKRGRKVTCAECGGVWQAEAVSDEPQQPDRLFNEDEEAALDAAFIAAAPPAAVSPAPPPAAATAAAPQGETPMRSIAEIKAAIAPRQRPPVAAAGEQSERKRQKEFAKRQAAQRKQSPLARVRRVLRIVGVGSLLAMLVCGVAFRATVVRQFPDLAGAYEALGLGVNVVGLEFRDVTTLVALKGGANVLRVDARIYSVAPRRLDVPPVAVTLLDEAGAALYEWSVVPDARELQPGEVVDFTTQLSTPPAGAARVRLTFMDSSARPGPSTTATMSK